MLFAPDVILGDITFTAHVITDSLDGAWSVYPIDLDGDGDMDVVSSAKNAASPETHKISWYENNGSESFTAHTITTNADNPYEVYAADLDGDGDVDVLSASREDDTIAWYENDGSESFTEHPITTSADYATSVYAIDVDGDGDVDVLSASKDDNTIRWHENNGSESFTAHTLNTSAQKAKTVYAIDMDGDGDMDVLSASPDDDTIAWYEQNGEIIAEDISVNINEDEMSEIMLGDSDNDELNFAIVNTPQYGTVSLMNNIATYIPNANYWGADEFMFMVSDDSGNSDTGTVSITILPVNDAPWLTEIPDQTTPQNTPLTIFLSASDVEGDVLTFSATSDNPENVAVSLTDAELTLIPEIDFVGMATITVAVSDGELTDMEEFLLIVQSAIETIETTQLSGWNLVGLPLEVENASCNILFPASIAGTLYSFDGGYLSESYLTSGEGYWLRFNEAGSTTITGVSINELIIHLSEGWNLISGITNSLNITSIQDPDGLIIPGTVYGFTTNGYSEEGVIHPGKGYWMRANNSGSIILTSD